MLPNYASVGEPFNAIFAKTNTKMMKSLVVLIHDGPHEQFTTDFNVQVNTLLEMDMAVLGINHRGSTGIGDASLESIITNIGLVSESSILGKTEFKGG